MSDAQARLNALHRMARRLTSMIANLKGLGETNLGFVNYRQIEDCHHLAVQYLESELRFVNEQIQQAPDGRSMPQSTVSDTHVPFADFPHDWD